MLYLIRHAQASYLSNDYDQLSNLGLAQSEALGSYLVDNIILKNKYVGPHKRQRQTANKIQKAYEKNHRPIPSPIYIDNLREHKGPATLQYHKQSLIAEDPSCSIWHQESIAHPNKLKENSIKIFEHFIPQWMDGHYSANHLEDFNTFKKEVSQGMNEILNTKEVNRNIALITSAGTISTIMAYLLNYDDNKKIAQISFEVYNASITSMYKSNGHWKISNFNQVDHLSNNMKTIV